MIRCMISDLDGTLFNADRTLDDVILSGLETIKEKGIYFVPATGRSRNMSLDTGLPESYGIFLNGGIIQGPDGEILAEQTLAKPVVETLLSEYASLNFEFYTADAIYMTCSREEGIAYYNARQEARGRLWFSKDYDHLFKNHIFDQKSEDILALDIIKANCFHSDTPLCHQLEEYIEKTEGIVNAPSDRVLFEITDEKANKADAARLLLQKLSVLPQECAVFGDGINDIEMLQQFDHSYAPASANPLALQAARHTVDGVKEYGVIRTMESLASSES